MKSVIPTINIHTWGGLGSQLYAVALANFLRAKYPRKHVKIVLHSSGVTRRSPEVADLFPEFEYKIEDDFVNNSKSISDSKNFIRFNIKLFVKIFLLKLRFIAYCDDDLQTKKIRPWTLSTRGHYSYRSIDSKFLSDLGLILKDFDRQIFNFRKSVCSIHYRLGDLLEIDEKSPIAASAILNEYSHVSKSISFDTFCVFSDSPVEANARFSGFTDKEILTPSLGTAEVISNASNAEYFIGTSSKVSFWIAAIRANNGNRRSSLPKKDEFQFRGLLRDKMDLISCYESQ